MTCRAKGFHAGNLVKTAVGELGGGGGGRPAMAQGRGKDPDKVKEALDALWSSLRGGLS